MKNNVRNFNEIKLQMLKSEIYLDERATKSIDAIRLNDYSSDIRLEYARDIDRIVHSIAYTRYIDKTQVYPSLYSEDISKRITHVQFVSRASKTIARALGLNEDLCEAISLGHDLGHVPFGHEGEYILNDISMSELGEIFSHNVQSVRDLMYIERGGQGLNLTVQTLDGILCHNGELESQYNLPVKKDLNIFLDEYKSCYSSSENIKKLRPMTLEGCVVRIADIIGYIGKDIEDSIKLNYFSREKIPDEICKTLGNNNIDIMNNLIVDVIDNSYNKDTISMSDLVYEMMSKLKKFNYDNIYKKSSTEESLAAIRLMFKELFYYYLEALEKDNKSSDIYKEFLNTMNEEYLSNNSNKRKVIDYIAGMTDTYMKNMYKLNIKGRI
ncbi:MAG: HD domain-containing protein [Clostridia bacterium]|nr:HD domain-containing protein [Clostridia bacterium]